MPRNPGRVARKPAAKLPHLRKKMQKQKARSRAARKRRTGRTRPVS